MTAAGEPGRAGPPQSASPTPSRIAAKALGFETKPFTGYLVDANRSARPLDAIKQFMFDNTAVIMMVVLLLLGTKLLGEGLAVL